MGEKKKNILILIHQLNVGGAQKALISALNAIDYNVNNVTLYVRKARLDLLPQVNSNVSKIIVNDDKTNYYYKLYAVWLQLLQLICKILHKDDSGVWKKLRNYAIIRLIIYIRKS